jgi:hypothetical protein
MLPQLMQHCLETATDPTVHGLNDPREANRLRSKNKQTHSVAATNSYRMCHVICVRRIKTHLCSLITTRRLISLWVFLIHIQQTELLNVDGAFGANELRQRILSITLAVANLSIIIAHFSLLLCRLLLRGCWRTWTAVCSHNYSTEQLSMWTTVLFVEDISHH